MVIQAYIDESIGKNRTFALGCAIAKGSIWERINHDWKRCLQRKNRQLTRQCRPRFSRYHATDCESRLGEFKGWDVSEKNAFVAELISIVNRHHVHIVGFTVYLEELAEFYPQIEKEYVEKAAYGALATLLFPEIVEQASQISRQPAIKMVYEHGEVTQHMQYAYDSMKSKKPFAELFESIEKNNWKVIPLQIADLIAFETMKDRDNQKGPMIRDRRRSLNAILGGKLTGAKGFHFGRDGLQRLALERYKFIQRLACLRGWFAFLTKRRAPERHNNLNKRARIGILQSSFPAKFFDSLAHASNADAEAIRTKLSNLRSNPLPVVPHGDG